MVTEAEWKQMEKKIRAHEKRIQQPRNIKDVIAELPEDERAKVEARAAELLNQQCPQEKT